MNRMNKIRSGKAQQSSHDSAVANVTIQVNMSVASQPSSMHYVTATLYITQSVTQFVGKTILILTWLKHTTWFLCTESRTEGRHTALLTNTRSSKTSHKTTELLLNTIYKLRRDIHSNLYSYVCYCTVVRRPPSFRITHSIHSVQRRTEGVGGSPPPPQKKNSEGHPKSYQTKPIVKTVKNCRIQDANTPKCSEKGSKILKLPPVRSCFTLALTNKLAVIINNLKVPKIKKILLCEMKFLVPNYSCLQDP